MIHECNICLEEYNKSIKIAKVVYRTGNKIKCTKCEYSTCTYCTKKYLLDSANDARCMNCQHPWNRSFLVENFTKSFINKEYKEYRENMLLDREKALIPATMEILDRENQIKTLSIEKEIFRKKMEETLYDFDVKIWTLQNTDGVKKTKNTFVKKCSVENCKGFLSSKWKCGICEIHTCKECHGIIGKRIYNDDGTTELPYHECNKDDVKTARLLAKECKNCPKCSAPIYKIDGCDQMWCIECKTAFSWRSGEIIRGHFHNPHYYEWLRQNNNGEVIPREPGDNPCHISIITLRNHLNEILFSNCTNLGELEQDIKEKILNKDYTPIFKKSDMCKYKNYNIGFIISFLADLHRLCNHISDININNIDHLCLVNDENHLFNYNLHSRKKYLKNIIDEEYFKKEIQKNEKKKLKFIDRKQLYLTFTNVINDIFRKLVSDNTPKNIINCLKEIITIVNHINSQFLKHSHIYSCKIDLIDIFKCQKKFYFYRSRNERSINTMNCVNIDFVKHIDLSELNFTYNIFKN
tara:strand:+ start:17008 stop:18576 length:1569 start_codon:yes stop_codon:yes gene_type:complete